MALLGFQRDRNRGGKGPALRGQGVTPVEPVHHVRPSSREMRAQAVHRLQVGLFGLGAILLLISLANVIMERAELISRAAALDPTAEASATTETANDPLVDMGVAPELPVGGGSAQQPPSQQQQQQPSQQQ